MLRDIDGHHGIAPFVNPKSGFVLKEKRPLQGSVTVARCAAGSPILSSVSELKLDLVFLFLDMELGAFLG